MLDKLLENKFFKSTIYFSLITIFTTVFWFFKIDGIGLYLFSAIAVFILVFSSKAINSLPFIVSMLFMVSKTDWGIADLPLFIYILPPLALIAIGYHVIRYKISFKGGKLNLPLLLMMLAMVLSIINIPDFQAIYALYYFGGAFYIATYIFFKGSLTGDNLSYLIKFFTFLGVMIAVHVFLFYLRTDDPLAMIRSGEIHLGWNLSNFVATYLIMFSSLMIYYIKIAPYRYKYIYIILFLFEVGMLLLTLSRGGVLAFIVTSVFLSVYLLYSEKITYHFFIYLAVGFIFSLLMILLNLEYFKALYERIFTNFLSDNGRWDLYEKAFNRFLGNPLFGVGFFAEYNGTYFPLYHNTFMHTLATMGLVGLAALIWQIVEVLKIFFKSITKETMILLLAVVGANIHGMIDNVYYMPQFMIIFFIIVAAVENYNEMLIPVKQEIK